MTTRTPTYLKSVFESGDIPSGSDYSDIFDSFLPITATGKQTLDISLEIGGDFTASGDIYGRNIFTNTLNAQQVSASVANYNQVNAQIVSASVANFNQINAQIVSASTANFNRVNANMVSASGGEFNVINAQRVSASAGFFNHMRQSVIASVNAAGTTTASATLVSAGMTVIQVITSGSNEGVALKRARPGFQQFIINNTTVTAKVYPTSASKFNTLSNGVAYDLPNLRTLQVFHITSAQYYTATHVR